MKHLLSGFLFTAVVLFGTGTVWGQTRVIRFVTDGKAQESKFLWKEASRSFVLADLAKPTRNLDGENRYAIYRFDVTGATSGTLRVNLLNSTAISIGSDGQTFTEVFREEGTGGSNGGWKMISLEKFLPNAFRYLYIKFTHGAAEKYRGAFGGCIFEIELTLQGQDNTALGTAQAVCDPITLDGNFDERTWQRTQVLDTFSDRFMMRLPLRKTSYRLAYDADHWYIAAQCEQPGADTTAVTAKEHDSAVYADDSLELFFQPPGQRDYYHLAVNALGTVFDQLNGNGADTWQSEAKTAARRTPKGWSVEIALDRKHLKSAPLQSGQAWRVGLYRSIMEFAQMVAWSSVESGGWHSPARFGTVELSPAAETAIPFVNLYTPVAPLLGDNTITMMIGGLANAKDYALTLAMLPVKAPNLPDSQQNLAQMNPVTYDVPLDNLVSGQTVVHYTIDRFGAYHLIGTLNRKADKKTLSRAVLSLTVTPENVMPLEVALQQPFVSTETTIPCTIKVNLSDPKKKGSYLLAVLNDAVGKEIQRFTRQDSTATEITVPVNGLALGEYKLRVELFNSAGDMLSRIEKPLTKFKPDGQPHRVTIGKNQVCYVDGKAMMPLGFMLGGANTGDLEAGYNVGLWPCEGNPINDKCGLDRAAANGTLAILHLCDYLRGKNDFDGLRARVSRLKNEPGLFAWYLADEPEAYGDTPDILRKAYNIIKAIDNNHPVYIVTNAPGMLKYYQGCADVIGADPYPIEGHPLSLVADWTDAAVTAAQANQQAVWMVPQGFGFADIGANGRAPTSAEFSTMLYTCFIHGAKGIIWWPYGAPRSKYWDHFTRMGRESRLVEPWMLAGTDVETMRNGLQVNNGIHWRAWKLNHRILILAANLGKTPATVTVAAPAERTLELPFETKASNVHYNSTTGQLTVTLDYAQSGIMILN